jgi:predicted ATP-binding protein involved in virulence
MIAGGSKAVSGIKAGSKEVISGGLFKTGLKDYYQKQTLSKYFAKNNVIPEKGIKKWWINVSARQDRRNSFRKFIGANNLLAYFGIPSLTTFERKMSEDEEFRKKIAEDPKTSDYIAQNYEKEDTVVNQNNSSQQQTSQNNSNSSQESDQIQNFLSKTFGKGLNDALSFN